jgi:hypothetical protein
MGNWWVAWVMLELRLDGFYAEDLEEFEIYLLRTGVFPFLV